MEKSTGALFLCICAPLAVNDMVEKIAKEHCVPVTLLCDTNHDLIFDIGL